MCRNCGNPIAHDGYDWYHADGVDYDTECPTTRDTTWNPSREYATPTE